MARRIFTARSGGNIAVRLPAGLGPLLDEQFASLDVLLTTEDPVEGLDPLAALTGMTGGSEDRPAPADPALRRLRPDAYGPEVEDGAAAREYRRLMGGSLEALQRERVARVRESLTAGEQFTLDPEAAQAWLGALNDLRLALGVRLEVSEDPADWPAPDDPRAAAFGLYDYLLAVQADLLAALGAPSTL